MRFWTFDAGYVGGGYDADLDVLADRHIVLHKTAAHLWDDYQLGRMTS